MFGGFTFGQGFFGEIPGGIIPPAPPPLVASACDTLAVPFEWIALVVDADFLNLSVAYEGVQFLVDDEPASLAVAGESGTFVIGGCP